MGIIAWIIIGLLAGAIAKAIMPGKDPGGVIITMLIGIAGGLLGGWLGKVIFGVDSIDGFLDLSTWVAAIVGSIILLALYRLVTGNRRNAFAAGTARRSAPLPRGNRPAFSRRSVRLRRIARTP